MEVIPDAPTTADLSEEAIDESRGTVLNGLPYFCAVRQSVEKEGARLSWLAPVINIENPFINGEDQDSISINRRHNLGVGVIAVYLRHHGLVAESEWLDDTCQIAARNGESIEQIRYIALNHLQSANRDLYEKFITIHQ